MKIQADRIKDALRYLMKVSRKTPSDMTSLIMISAGDGALTLSTTDFKTIATARIDCETAEAQSLAVDAKRFADTVRSAQGTVSIAFEDAHIVIKKGRSKTRLIGLDCVDSWRTCEQDGDALACHPMSFAAAIEMTRRSASKDDARPNLCGIYTTTIDGLRRWVATDGHRMTIAEIESPADDAAPMTIPIRTAQIIASMCQDGAVLRSDGHWLSAEGDGIVIHTRLIDATFPDYAQVIPRAREVEPIAINQAAFLQALRDVGAIKDKPAIPVILQCSEIDNTLIVRTDSADYGSAETIVDFTGPMFDGIRACSLRYLQDAIESMPECETITLSAAEPLDPIVVRPIDEIETYSILMPVRM